MGRIKNIRHLVAMAFLAVFSFTSCIKPITNEGPNPVTATNITCMIEGVAFQAHASAMVDHNGFITIEGHQADGQDIVMSLSGTRPGVYTLGRNGISVTEYLIDMNNVTEGFTSNSSFDASGSVTITSINPQAKTFSGVFSFTAVRASDNAKKHFTNGVFTDVHFSGDLPVSASTLYAKIGNYDWTTNTVSFQTDSHGLTMTASDYDQQSIAFILPANIGPGTYTLSNSGDYTATSGDKYGSIYHAVSGVINITDHTSKGISGTFNFKGVNQFNSSDIVDISNGSFDAQF